MNQLNQSLRTLLSESQRTLSELDEHAALAVHELRKQTKFIRALLQLSPAAPSQLKQSLKSFSALLAPYRDAQVSLDIYKLLTDNAPMHQDFAFENSLRNNPFYLDSKPLSAQGHNLESRLTDLSLIMGILTAAPEPDHILASIQASYDIGRAAMVQVKMDPNMEDLHTWRKKTKTLWYQLRFLFGDSLEDVNHPLVLSDQLGQLLGEIHDSDVLDTLLVSQSNPGLRGFIRTRRSELLSRALDLGEKLYCEAQPRFSQLLQTAT